MSTAKDARDTIDLEQFHRNRDQVPDHQLVPFWGKQVAWSADGTRILASAETFDALVDRMERAGIDPAAVVFDFIHDPNTSYFG